MSAQQFRASEDLYFKLRGQFDTGRITQEQFDEKLRELMVHDSQGRYWMLGADSGKWYFYDGANWVQADPFVEGAAVAAPVAAGTAPAAAEPAPVPSAAPAAPQTDRSFPIVPILGGVIIVALAIVAFLLFQNRDRIFVAQQPPSQITPILPPTITRAPSPTPFGAPTDVAAGIVTPPPQNEVPTPIPTTGLPPTTTQTDQGPTAAITVIFITLEPTTPGSLPSATDQPTELPSATEVLATATRPSPSGTPLPNVPADVYVTELTVDPIPAFKNQNARFTATFLNTTGSPRSYNWLVLLYDPSKTGPNKGFGESTEVPVTIPVGTSTLSIDHIPAKGPGGCINLYARVGWKISAFEKPIFPNTTGEPATVYFDVCPP